MTLSCPSPSWKAQSLDINTRCHHYYVNLGRAHHIICSHLYQSLRVSFVGVLIRSISMYSRWALKSQILQVGDNPIEFGGLNILALTCGGLQDSGLQFLMRLLSILSKIYRKQDNCHRQISYAALFGNHHIHGSHNPAYNAMVLTFQIVILGFHLYRQYPFQRIFPVMSNEKIQYRFMPSRPRTY